MKDITFTFTKVETGGKLIITGKTEAEVRERKNLDPDLWTLDRSLPDETSPDSSPPDESPPDE